MALTTPPGNTTSLGTLTGTAAALVFDGAAALPTAAVPVWSSRYHLECLLIEIFRWL
jgi:hypothetical protein